MKLNNICYLLTTLFLSASVTAGTDIPVPTAKAPTSTESNMHTTLATQPAIVDKLLAQTCQVHVQAQVTQVSEEEMTELKRWFDRLEATGGSREFLVGKQRVHLGQWSAPLGRFEHPGSAAGETFIMLDGVAVLEINGQKLPMTSASMVSIPSNTPSALNVSKPLDKLYLVCSV